MQVRTNVVEVPAPILAKLISLGKQKKLGPFCREAGFSHDTALYGVGLHGKKTMSPASLERVTRALDGNPLPQAAPMRPKVKRGPRSDSTPVPPEVREFMQQAYERGELNKTSRLAGIDPNVLRRVLKREQAGMHIENLQRVQALMAGHVLPPKPGSKLARRAKPVVDVQHLPLNGTNGHSLSNGREAGLRAMLDGLALGVEITRRSVTEFLSK